MTAMTDLVSPLSKPSWFDRFAEWLDSLPGPYWAAVLIIYVLLSVQSQVVNWIAGAETWWKLNPVHLFYQLFTAEVLYFWRYLDRDALRGLAAFRPLYKASDDTFSGLAYRFSHQPARPVAVITIAGILVGAYYAYSVSLMNTGTFTLSVSSFYGILGFSIPMILALVFCYRLIRQLRIVSELYESATEIDLFNLDPVYALSSHTAKTGLIFLFLVYSNLLLVPGSIQIPTALVTTIAISIISFLAFALPLRGINQRLVAEKKAMVREINARIKSTFTLLEDRVDREEWDHMPGLERALSSLERQKHFVEKIPTWPWKPGTLRGFISAMLLPIVLWAVQQVLERYLTF
jgi:hypothetical protein